MPLWIPNAKRQEYAKCSDVSTNNQWINSLYFLQKEYDFDKRRLPNFIKLRSGHPR